MRRVTGTLALCWLMFGASCSSITVAGSGDDAGTDGVVHRGTGGSGGSTDAGSSDASDPCPALEAAYASALPDAKRCDPNATTACQKLVSTSIACSGCSTVVNDTSGLDAIEQEWQAAGCASMPRVCPAIACRIPGTGQCVVSSTAAGGASCVDAVGPLPP
jgi:hypothetical protein